MTILELKNIISELPDDMEVLVPAHPMEQFDGSFFSPCVMESGIMSSPEIRTEEDYEDAMENEAIGLPIKEIESFHLVPCGYFSKHGDMDVTMN